MCLACRLSSQGQGGSVFAARFDSAAAPIERRTRSTRADPALSGRPKLSPRDGIGRGKRPWLSPDLNGSLASPHWRLGSRPP